MCNKIKKYKLLIDDNNGTVVITDVFILYTKNK